MRWIAACVAALALTAGAPFLAAPAAAGPPAQVTYVPPVDDAVIDPFRPPDTKFGAGNRGIDYATRPGTPVRAAAPGEVVFAGAVGFTRHVVVLHPDGLRTSYSFLQSVAVTRGQRVAAGHVLGTAGPALHFGVRAGDAYLDPMALFGGPPRVHLVPDAQRVPLPEPAERAGLGRSLAGFFGAVVGAPADAVAWAGGKVTAGVDVAADVAAWAKDHAGAGAAYLRDQVIQSIDAWAQDIRTLLHYASSISGMALMPLHVAFDAWNESHRLCTPDDEPPPKPAGRRIAVLVAGLGSASNANGEAGSVADLDEAALGYAADDVLQFSYKGGTTKENTYKAKDTLGDIDDSGKLLAALLRRVARQHPGVPIDVIAHSQGGIVARAAFAYHLNLDGPGAPKIGTLVTLGSPHKGADLATAGFAIGRTPVGGTVLDVASALSKSGFVHIDPKATSVQQLAETSSFMRKLNKRGIPDGLRVVSIAATTDVVVTSTSAHLNGAQNVVVDLPGQRWWSDHSDLPGSAVAQREVALALSGEPPTCTTFTNAFLNAFPGEVISRMTDAAAALGTYSGGRKSPLPDMTHTTVRNR